MKTVVVPEMFTACGKNSNMPNNVGFLTTPRVGVVFFCPTPTP